MKKIPSKRQFQYNHLPVKTLLCFLCNVSGLKTEADRQYHMNSRHPNWAADVFKKIVPKEVDKKPCEVIDFASYQRR